MSYYVRRAHPDGREGWVGPLRAERRAIAEADAWIASGWEATVHESSPKVRALVRGWERNVALARAAHRERRR